MKIDQSLLICIKLLCTCTTRKNTPSEITLKESYSQLPIPRSTNGTFGKSRVVSSVSIFLWKWRSKTDHFPKVRSILPFLLMNSKWALWNKERSLWNSDIETDLTDLKLIWLAKTKFAMGYIILTYSFTIQFLIFFFFWNLSNRNQPFQRYRFIKSSHVYLNPHVRLPTTNEL